MQFIRQCHRMFLSVLNLSWKKKKSRSEHIDMGKPSNTYAVRTSSGSLIEKVITLFPLDTRNSFKKLGKYCISLVRLLTSLESIFERDSKTTKSFIFPVLHSVLMPFSGTHIFSSEVLLLLCVCL